MLLDAFHISLLFRYQSDMMLSFRGVLIKVIVLDRNAQVSSSMLPCFSLSFLTVFMAFQGRYVFVDRNGHVHSFLFLCLCLNTIL